METNLLSAKKNFLVALQVKRWWLITLQKLSGKSITKGNRAKLPIKRVASIWNKDTQPIKQTSIQTLLLSQIFIQKAEINLDSVILEIVSLEKAIFCLV